MVSSFFLTFFPILLTFLLFKAVDSDILYEELLKEANSYYNELLEIRRHIHKYPELGFQEFNTSKYIQNILKENNITFTTGWGVNVYSENKTIGTGIVADIGTGHSPCVGIRADMDALPITELADVPFKSINDGVMHACGHDVHVTMLLGAAKLLKARENELNGTFRLIFQPSEEVGGGGFMMANEGVLQKYPPVERITAVHVLHEHATGKLISRPGVILSGAYNFKVIVQGKGGHAALPHKTIDPITAASAMIRSLYDAFSRELYFQEDHAGVFSISYIDAGLFATNVIPDNVEFGGTLRTISPDKFNYLVERLNEITQSTSKAFRCTAEVIHEKPSYIPTYNDPELYELFSKYAQDAGIGPIVYTEPEMVAEDYSFYAKQVPSVFYSIGTGSASEVEGHSPSNIPEHNQYFVVDERVLPIGSAFNAYVSLRILESLNEKK